MQSSHFLVYKSSAGSGKTFTLVKEYLKLALKDKHHLTNSFKGILAITFTNKAAAEMKWRIVKALREISTDKNDFLTNLIAEELNIDQHDLKERTSLLLTSILHHYSDFSIGTIDSFTHRIIRTFAIDLQLPFNFQIETDTDSVFNKVINTLISNLGKDETITNYLVQFSLAQVEENKSWDPEKLLFDFVKEINKEGDVDVTEEFSDFTISDFEVIKHKLNTYIKSYQLFLKEKGSKGLELIKKTNIPLSAFSGGGTIPNFFNKIQTGEKIAQEEIFLPTVFKTLETNVWHASKATKSEKELIYTISDELKAIVYVVLDYVKENEQKYTVYDLIYKNIYAMGLVNELAKLTNAYKLDENVLFLSEFNERISQIVSDEPTPFIFERLGDRYKHFLLDEFQDTSAMQWRNLLPLTDNALANGNLNLVVGDGKQSIYRWRNANVEQFVNLPYINNPEGNELIKEREASLIRNFKEDFLDTNFRSQPEIVKFNNHLFEQLSSSLLNDDFKRIYNKQEQKYKSGTDGYVSIQFPELSKEHDSDTVNTNLVLSHIQQAISDGYLYSDICVIVNKNANGNVVANFLIERNIPVVSRESLLLANATEVVTLVAFLKFILNHNDLVSASVVVNYLYLNAFFTEEKYIELLKYINLNKKSSLLKLLKEQGIKIDEFKITNSNLYDCCVEIVKALQLHIKNPQYIRFFLDEVLSFLQTNTSNVSTFLTWWEKRSIKASVIIPEGINAVNIMTIHASKGLEFPIVIAPYMNFRTDKTNPIWVKLQEENDDLNLPIALLSIGKKIATTPYKHLAEKELMMVKLDCLNMLYVNFTRAVERLHIISPKPIMNAVNSTYTWLLDYAKTQAHYDSLLSIIEFGALTAKDTQAPVHIKLEQLQLVSLQFNDENPIKIKNGSAYNSSEESVRAREYGILVHYILSQIKSKDDIAAVVQKSILKGDITEQEAVLITTDLSVILMNEKISAYFEPNLVVKNEFEIVTETGDILRPDRVVIIDETSIVIDYKTVKKQIAKYHSQMQDYKNALLKLGYKTVVKILLYIHEKEVEILN